MVTDKLYESYRDDKYKAFSSRLSLTDTLPRAGIRIPVLRSIAKNVKSDDIEIRYHEDVILKALALAYEKSPFDDKKNRLNAIFPYLSSWDQTDVIATGFPVKAKNKDFLYSYFHGLLSDERIYPRRLGIVWLMSNRKHFDSKSVIKDIINADIEDEYYISMAIAWALSMFYIDDEENLKYFDAVLPKTLQRTKQKIRDSKRYKGQNLNS